MVVNIARLKGKIVEHGNTQEAVASAIGMDRSTFYRKLKDGGEKFTIGEIHGIVSAVPLSREEAIDIFLHSSRNNATGGINVNSFKKALDDKGITIRAFAKVLGVDERTIQNKIKGKTPFTYPEAVLSKKELFPEYDLEYLFKEE